MKIWKFHRWIKDPATGTWHESSYVSEDVFVKVWEIAFSEAEMNAKLDGDMAEVIDPGKSWHVQFWRRFFPLKMIEC